MYFQILSKLLSSSFLHCVARVLVLRVFMMDSSECPSCLPCMQGLVHVGAVGLRRGDGEDVELGGRLSHLWY